MLVDVDAAPTDPAKPHADPGDIRFGLYGALAHPMEAVGIGSCDGVKNLVIQSLSAPGGTRLTSTVCLGPMKDRAAVRGVYLYSPRDRIAGTAAAYAAAFPVGVLPTNESDTGLVVRTTSVAAWRADGSAADSASLGAGCVQRERLHAARIASRHHRRQISRRLRRPRRADDAARLADSAAAGPEPGLHGLWGVGADPAGGVAGRGARQRVAVHAGRPQQALLYATVAIVGTHAAVWMTK